MKTKLGWFFMGAGLGVLLCLGVAYAVGTKGQTTKMDLYTGQTWSSHHWLWHRWQREDPFDDSVIWAKQHLDAKRTYWPIFVCSDEQSWFGGTVHADGFAWDIPRLIYQLDIPEKEKIEMLKQFHGEVDDMIDRQQVRHLQHLYQRWEPVLVKKGPER